MTFAARAMQQYGPYMHERDSAHPWVGVIIVLLVGAAIGVGLWALLRGRHQPAPYAYPGHLGPPPVAVSDPALDALRLRFARGEIDADEYAQRAALLTGGPPPGPPAA